MAYNSPSRDGLLIAVNAGLAVTVAPVSTVTDTLEVLDATHSLPALPPMELSMHLSKRHLSQPAKLLAAAIRETLSVPAKGLGRARSRQNNAGADQANRRADNVPAVGHPVFDQPEP